MPSRSRDQHQPEPWSYEGRAILNANGWTLAKTIFEADARRIVAAINDVMAIPTAALEAGFIREILVPRPDSTDEVTIRIHPVPRARWIRRTTSSTIGGSASAAGATAAGRAPPRRGGQAAPRGRREALR